MQHWQEFETILLDMDGTILDLAFDNYFWRELVPRCLARARGAPEAEIRAELFAHYAGKQGSLDWYCIDYWTKALDLDLRSLKSASSHRVRFLPGAPEFLACLVGSGQRIALVTNAHGYTLEVKKGVAGLGRFIETFVSSHDFGVPKEDAEFWPEAARRLGFDPNTTLFIDDSLPVLRAAQAFGLRGVLAVSRPDSRHPVRPTPGFTAVEAIGELLAVARPG
jgi:5'-nucleotidase